MTFDKVMEALGAALTLVRVGATAIGYIVILMALAGHCGVADFRLSFSVPEAAV